MKRLLLTMVSVAVLANVAVAADQPDFSGSWKMNAAKSDYAMFPAPSTFVRHIVHKGPNLTVSEEQSRDGVDANTTRKMTTDGVVTENNINGAPVNCSATWEGTTLTVKTAVDIAGLTYNDKMSLSADGKVLTSKVRVEFPQGSGDITVVFDRL